MHEVYLKYKDRGFEFVSICLDGKDDAKIREINAKYDLTCRTLNSSELREEYAFGGGEHKFFLDREGRLIRMNDEVAGSRLPVAIEEALLLR